MGSFNFGAARLPGHRKKVGAWDAPRRSDTPITSKDIKSIAERYFVEQASMIDIGEQYGVGPAEIKKITKGENFHQDWTVVIADLIAGGVPCVRSKEAKAKDRKELRGTGRPERLEAEVVLDIRRRHMAGESLPEILAATGLMRYRVRAILRNETFNDDMFKPPGWRKDMTNWRKDSE